MNGGNAGRPGTRQQQEMKSEMTRPGCPHGRGATGGGRPRPRCARPGASPATHRTQAPALRGRRATPPARGGIHSFTNIQNAARGGPGRAANIKKTRDRKRSGGGPVRGPRGPAAGAPVFPVRRCPPPRPPRLLRSVLPATPGTPGRRGASPPALPLLFLRRRPRGRARCQGDGMCSPPGARPPAPRLPHAPVQLRLPHPGPGAGLASQGAAAATHLRARAATPGGQRHPEPPRPPLLAAATGNASPEARPLVGSCQPSGYGPSPPPPHAIPRQRRDGSAPSGIGLRVGKRRLGGVLA